MFDVDIREDFPILHTHVHGKPLVYLDNAATTQKPRAVIDAHQHAITQPKTPTFIAACTHLSQTRDRLCTKTPAARSHEFINAAESREIIFTRGTTEGDQSRRRRPSAARVFKPGDEVIVSRDGASLQHRPLADRLPEQTGAMLRVIPMNDAGELLLDEYEQLLKPANETRRGRSTSPTRSARSTTSNAITEMAHAVGARC